MDNLNLNARKIQSNRVDAKEEKIGQKKVLSKVNIKTSV